MKKGKIKTWMILLSILTISIVPINKVKALTQSEQINRQNVYANLNGLTGVSVRPQNATQTYLPFNNYGEGELIFTFLTASGSSPSATISEVSITTGTLSTPSDIFECDIGTIGTYVDNTSYNNVYTARCPVNFNSKGLYSINYNRNGNTGILLVYTSMIGTFISKDSISVNVNQQQVVDATIASTQALVSQLQTFNNNVANYVNSIVTEQQAQRSAINTQTQHQDANYNEFKNEDISATDKQQPNQDSYDTYENREQSVYDNLDQQDPNLLIDMAIDTDTNNWIWNLITSIKGTHIRIQMLMITMLSLGLCKFILGR